MTRQKIKLRVKNETDYRTSDIRKLFIECMKQEGVVSCFVKVKSTSGRTHGTALLNSHWVTMYLPDTLVRYHSGSGKTSRVKYAELKDDEAISVAQVFRHELGHNLGLRHDDMVALWKIDCDWASQYTIRRKKPPKKKSRDVVKERHEKALKKVKHYTSKVKLYTTLLKKWKKKLAYYEKKQG